MSKNSVLATYKRYEMNPESFLSNFSGFTSI